MILDEIAVAAEKRTAEDMKKISYDEMKRRALDPAENGRFRLPPFAFEQALKKEDISFICEVKKASPSKGIIAEDFPYVEIAREYENAGADCISCLTEPEYFKGSDKYLAEIKEAVGIPVLRKDFTVNDYQIYQAKVLGADCVLLICALLDTETLKKYIKICDTLGLAALVEAHDETEIFSAITAGARIIGVNNRDLKTFTVDVRNSEKHRKLVPDHILFVAESGIRTAADIDVLRNANVNGVLIGETLMRADNKSKELAKLRGGHRW